MSYYQKSVPGSAVLKTRRRGSDPEIDAAESMESGAMERVARGQDALGRVVVRDHFIPVLDRVFEDLAPCQTVLEQVLYLHLYRASYGQQLNYCRLTRADLCARIGLSTRRFNHALAGLVHKGHVALLQRDRRGTLYRVFLPDEIFGRRPGGDVLLGRVRAGETMKAKARSREVGGQAKKDKKRVSQSASSEPKARHARSLPNRGHKVTPSRMPDVLPQESQEKLLSVGSVTRRLLEKVPATMRGSLSLDALQEITDLMVEGHGLFEIDAAVQALPMLKGSQIAFAELLRQRLSCD